MKIWQFLVLWLFGSLLLIIQVTWLSAWPGFSRFLHLTLLFVLLFTLRTEWRSGVLLALLLGAMYQFFSSLPAWIHPSGFALAAAGAWVIRRRLVTTRTGSSVIISVLGGTAIYYLTVGSLLLINKIFNSSILTPVWIIWATAAAWQLAVHPFLAGVWWVATRQRQAALHI